MPDEIAKIKTTFLKLDRYIPILSSWATHEKGIRECLGVDGRTFKSDAVYRRVYRSSPKKEGGKKDVLP